MVKLLEQAFELFYDLHLDWKNKEKEEKYHIYIKNILLNKKFHIEIIHILNNSNRELRIQAFLIISYSQSIDLCKKMLTTIMQRTDINDFMAFLGYLDEKSFSILFDAHKSIGFDTTPQHILITGSFLNYISMNMLTKYIVYFVNYKQYNTKLQSHIILKLRYFLEAKNIIMQAYTEEHPVFYTKDKKKDNGCIGLTFLLQQNEDLAFRYLRESTSILDKNQYGLFYLNKFGDKRDGKFILNTFQNAMKKNEINASTLYILLEKLMSTTNPILCEGLLEHMQLNNYQLNKRLHYFFTLQYQKFIPQRECEKIQVLLAEIANNERESSSLNSEEKKLVSPTYLFDFWNKIISNVTKYQESQNKMSFSTNQLNSIDMNLSDYPFNGYTTEALPEHLSLILYTGKYLPYDNTGFYSKFKEHLNSWNVYLSENRNNFYDGRWFRYGKYVDQISSL